MKNIDYIKQVQIPANISSSLHMYDVGMFLT